MYDVIVVGARCAGSPVAMLLARQGARVLLVDKVSFPHDTVSTHYLQPTGLARLRDWGLLDRLAATHITPIRKMTVSLMDTVISGFSGPIEGIDHSYAPRRSILDAILVDAAREAGAEIRESYSVLELIETDGRVTGIRGRSKGGAVTEEIAPLVVGADGRNSVVGSSVGAEFTKVVPAGSFIYYSYWSGLDISFHSRFGDLQQVGAWPTNDDLTLVATMRPRAHFDEFRHDIEGNFEKVVREVFPELAEQMATSGQRAEKFSGIRYPDNFYRRSNGPGWVLVGDAGYHKDPVTGQGITDAFGQADRLARQIARGLAGEIPLDEATAEFVRDRDAESGAAFMLACTLGELVIPAELQALFGAVSHSEFHSRRFFDMIGGGLTGEEFFAPENLNSIFADAGRAA